MSLGSMFSSPGKQASQAASAAGASASQVIGQLQQYTDQHQQQLRDAIAGQGPNPYFEAAQQVNPQAYYTNPSDTVTFGTSGPGTSNGNPFAVASPTAGQAPPPLPNVILAHPSTATSPQPTPTNPFTGGPGGNGSLVPPRLGGGPPIGRIPIREEL